MCAPRHLAAPEWSPRTGFRLVPTGGYDAVAAVTRASAAELDRPCLVVLHPVLGVPVVVGARRLHLHRPRTGAAGRGRCDIDRRVLAGERDVVVDLGVVGPTV